MNSKITKSFITIIIAAAMMTSCGKVKTLQKKDNLASVQKKDKVTIGFSIDTLAIERWRRDLDVFLATAKSIDAEVIVQNAGNDVNEQIKQIQYLIDKNVDVLIILPKKADSLSEVIKAAKAKNIPVVSYDRLIRNADIDLYLTVDSSKVGEAMASEVLKRRPYGTLYCLYGPLDDFNMVMIKDSVEKTLKGSQLRTGEIFFTDNWNYDLAYKKMRQLLADGQYPNAIICGNDAIANSVIQAITESKYSEPIIIAGQDADIVNCQHIVNGKQTLTVYKPITELSRQTVYAAVRLGKGVAVKDMENVNGLINNGSKDVPSILLEPIPVTKDNIDGVVIDSGFHTRDEVYRK